MLFTMIFDHNNVAITIIIVIAVAIVIVNAIIIANKMAAVSLLCGVIPDTDVIVMCNTENNSNNKKKVITCDGNVCSSHLTLTQLP